MSDSNHRTAHGLAASLSQQRTPVIVTFSDTAEAVDVFGDALYYAATEEQLVEFLGDLLVGWQELSRTLTEVQMPSGSYADVRIVPEGVLRHVILFDVTAKVIEQREILQASHETALSEQRRRVALERQLTLPARHRELHSAGSDWRLTDVLELLSWDMRARLDEIRGHSLILDEKVPRSSAEAHSIACIRLASMHLQAMTLACIIGLNGSGAIDLIEREPIDIRYLIAELQRQFAAGPQFQSLTFEVMPRVAGCHAMILDYDRTYQIFVCLISCLLDVSGHTLGIRVDANDAQLTVELLSDRGACGEDSDDRALHMLLHDSRYVASHHLATVLGGTLSSTQKRDLRVRLRLPLVPASSGARSESTKNPFHSITVLVAVDETTLRDRVVSQLLILGVKAQICADLVAVETESVHGDVAMIVLGGELAGADGVGLGYRLHARGIHRRMLLLRPMALLGSAAWILEGCRTVISPEANDESLRAAMSEALRS